ncbi:YlcI/YnfO family protein [Enterobacter ludwigii]|uniref:YlcI/YnfO family protein n=1 Tax=Enterobacter ludwigii TaxID=299767 RepID=UPI003BEEE9B3
MSVYKNAKSQMTTVRIPHDVIDGMEAVKQDGESNAGFIVTAMRGEIARRQASGSEENPLLSSLDALARAEEIGTKAGEEIQQLVSVVRDELQRRRAKSEPEG